ncbi:MAG: hypothetical protein ACYC2Z_08470 [Candidatus Nanopelagicales bacterium]
MVICGAPGDLARRKLLTGVAPLAPSSLAPDLRIVGTRGPNAIHRLIDRLAWRLPFERVCRESR